MCLQPPPHRYVTSFAMIIRLVGPGGAGKTTVGLALAHRLGIAFVDLDQEFSTRFGEISTYLAAHEYRSYAAQNVQVYLDTSQSSNSPRVMALSSGFMTYPVDIHPTYGRLIRDIANSPTTAVLLPSFDYETCVAETVQRQLGRPFSRPAAREEEVIRTRFGIYSTLPAMKFETMRPVDVVVDGLMMYLLPDMALKPSDTA